MEAKRKFDRQLPDDLVLLDDISEANIQRVLMGRLDQGLLYTRIGDVLVSMNPYTLAGNVGKLYKKSTMEGYYGRYPDETAPSVYMVAERAYRQLLSTGKNQSVLISGESGAGKTEAAKRVMEYLAAVSSDRAESLDNVNISDIKDALLQSNPITEAIGNAQTLRNDNSSRFGKFFNLSLDYNGTPLGGSITTYLLEKARVVHHEEGERSFHIFYQLCAAPGSIKSQLNLGSASDYAYTRGTTTVRGMDDSKEFREMDAAMAAVGIGSEDKMQYYRMVAGILHLGNVEFDGKRESCEVSRGSSGALRDAAALLQIAEKDLARALTHRTIQSRRETITSPLTTVDECIKTRDALAKALYSRGFLKIVDMINVTIATEMQELQYGLLDIYGFEIFEHNSFEQLCINFCNEKLQQLFIELTLRAEQEEYAREGIQWRKIDYFDNKVVCDLIESRRPAGIFAYMDEEAIIPQGSDKTLLSKLNQQLSRHPHFVNLATKTNNDPSEFTIRHYAGDVTYSTAGILAKHKDLLYRDLIMVAGRGSGSSFINDLFPEAREKHDGKKPVTAGTAFVKNMQLLIEELEKTEPSYIRTIKPNSAKRALFSEPELVTHQIKYLGLTEATRVRRAGFAFRMEYQYFVKRFKMLCPQTWPRASGRDKSDTTAILRAVGISDFEEGKSKLFIRLADDVFKIEAAREKALHTVARIIQKAYRAFKSRVEKLRLREQSVQLFNHNKRRRNTLFFYFIGDYIFAQDNELITSQIDGRVKFAERVNVLGAKGMVPHLLVVTSGTIFLFNTQYKLVRAHAVREVRDFTLSTYADGFMIMNLFSENPAKPEPTLIMECMRKAELTTTLRGLRKDFPLEFRDDVRVTTIKKSLFGKKVVEKTLFFEESRSVEPTATVVLQTKKDGVDPKTEMRVLVGVAFGANARIQLSDDVLQLVQIHRTQPGKHKFVPYADLRRNR